MTLKAVFQSAKENEEKYFQLHSGLGCGCHDLAAHNSDHGHHRGHYHR